MTRCAGDTNDAQEATDTFHVGRFLNDDRLRESKEEMHTTELNPASDFCQRWNNRQHTWRHRSDGGFDRDSYAVETLDEPTAKEYVTTHHYSGSYPAARLRYGLFDNDELVGVAVFGIPVQTAVLTNPFPDLEPFTESLELSRFVLADQCPSNSETWFLARCFEEAAAVGLRGVVSFADPVPRVIDGRIVAPGHVGTIYKASNATYTGRGAPQTMTLLPTGLVLNNRAKSKVRNQEQGHEHVERQLIALGARTMRRGEKPNLWLADALDDIGATKLRHRGNHRYLFSVGSRSQRRQVRMAGEVLAYPRLADAA